MYFSLLPFARTGLASVLALALGLIAASAAAAPTPAYEKILKIDVHSHIFEDVPAIHALFARINVHTINVCVPGGDGHLALMDRVAFELYGKHPQLYPVTTTFDLLTRDEPAYAARTIAATYRSAAATGGCCQRWAGLPSYQPRYR